MARQWKGRLHPVAAAIFLALAIVMTWPLAPNLFRAASDPGDPYIITWVLDWDWWATFRQPLSLFHANIFHPAKYTLAFSEHVYGIAMLLFPLRFAGLPPLAAYNVAMLAAFAFSGFAAYLLGWKLTRSFSAGMAAGVFYAFLPFRFIHLPHLQHVWGGWLPMLLVALLAYAEKPSRKRAALFAAAFVMNGLTNVHNFFFGSLAIAITAALLIPRDARRALVVATIAALAILAPFFYPYAAAAKLYGLQRSGTEVAHFSATPADWLPHDGEPERRLYPGAVAVLVALVGLAIRAASPRASSSKKLAILWMAIGFLGSLGFHTAFHTFLYGGVPGFRAIRVPARWAVIAYVGIAILIALATAAIARRQRIVAWLVPLALIIGLWQAPVRWYLTDPNPPAVHAWLAKQKLRGAVIEFPILAGASEYEAMFRATVHHQRLVNGISGFAPAAWKELVSLAHTSPMPDAFVDALAASNVELLIIHADLLGARKAEVREWLRRDLDRGRLAFVGRFDTRIDGDWVFRIAPEGAGPRPRELETFLAGAPVCQSSLMGALDFPDAKFTFEKGAIFSGWVVSHHGIRGVDLRLDNRRERFPAHLRPEPDLADRCAGAPGVTRARYIAVFDERPENVDRITDVQVEVTDGRGVKTVLDQRWLTWNRSGR